jgi:group II intron reverse transcriptase/maturase
VPLLRAAYESLKKRAAAGVDGVTWKSYGDGLEGRLRDLKGRVQRGSYHPPPVRRVYIPKADGKQRPLGIPALEDKVVQQAARWLLEQIYEREFKGFSYGFRPGRNPHQALDALHVVLKRGTRWVLDADLKAFFDTVDHVWLKRFIEHRIKDQKMVRLVMKWLKAGVMEDGVRKDVEQGTPQGGIISPLLANIYLHYALDLWVDKWRKGARAEVCFVRYADDFVMCFQNGRDAQQMRVEAEERLKKFGLTLHPEKTRVIELRARRRATAHQHRTPESFDFLGFTHVVTEMRHGRVWVHRRTSKQKRKAKYAALREEMRRRKHEPVEKQHQWLTQVMRGYFRYYAVPGNLQTLRSFRHQLSQNWQRLLQKRSQRGRWNNEDRRRHEKRYPLPSPRVCHSLPIDRWRPLTKGGSPVREIRSPGSVRGAP